MTQIMSVKETRNKLADVINQVSVAKDTVVVTKFGTPKAMIIPYKDKVSSSVLEETFGAWKDGTDIKDTARWVSSLRSKMSLRK